MDGTFDSDTRMGSEPGNPKQRKARQEGGAPPASAAGGRDSSYAVKKLF